MRHLIEKFCKDHDAMCFDRSNESFSGRMIEVLLDFIESPEFAARYEHRIKPTVDFGLGESVNQKWSIAMTALQDAATAFAAALKTAVASNAIDPAHLATLDTEVANLQTNAATDEANVADLTAAFTTITTALTTAAAQGPSPAPGPLPGAA